MSDVPQGPDWWKASDGKFYPPAAQPGPEGPPSLPGPPPSDPTSTGFLRSLYDFKFTEFVTPRMIRFFYGLSVVILTIAAAVYIIAALASGDEATIVGRLIFVPIIYLLYLIFTRISLELVAIIFRMADDLREIRRRGGTL